MKKTTFIIISAVLAVGIADSAWAVVEKKSRPTRDKRPSFGRLEKYEKYDKHRPNFALGLGGVLGGQGTYINNKGQEERLKMHSFDLSAEYQPAFLQGMGVLGVGPTVGLPQMTYDSATKEVQNAYYFGGQVRYQFRYVRGQVLVPMISYMYQRWNLVTTNGTDEFSVHGPAAGLWLYLNFLDNQTAKDLYQGYGVARTYAYFEVRKLEGSGVRTRIFGVTYNTGIRFEF